MAIPASTEHIPVWSDLLLTGHPAIDDTHREFAQLIRGLQLASEGSASDALFAIKTHCEDHFSEEEVLMRQSGYPNSECHCAEHEAVRLSVAEVYGWWKPGRDVHTVHRLGNALAGWFTSHTSYLDSALSQWIVKKQYGGAPVVLRRSGITCNVD